MADVVVVGASREPQAVSAADGPGNGHAYAVEQDDAVVRGVVALDGRPVVVPVPEVVLRQREDGLVR
jgi:hypothetical protein